MEKRLVELKKVIEIENAKKLQNGFRQPIPSIIKASKSTTFSNNPHTSKKIPFAKGTTMNVGNLIKNDLNLKRPSSKQKLDKLPLLKTISSQLVFDLSEISKNLNSALNQQNLSLFPEINEFLVECNCEKYLAKFIENGFDDLEIFNGISISDLDLENHHLINLGLNDNEANRILSKLGKIKTKGVRFTIEPEKKKQVTCSTGTDAEFKQIGSTVNLTEIENSKKMVQLINEPEEILIENNEDNGYISSKTIEKQKDLKNILLYSGGNQWSAVGLSQNELKDYKFDPNIHKEYCSNCFNLTALENIQKYSKIFCSEKCLFKYQTENKVKCLKCPKEFIKSEENLANGIYFCKMCKPSEEILIAERVGIFTPNQLLVYRSELLNEDCQSIDLFEKRRRLLMD